MKNLVGVIDAKDLKSLFVTVVGGVAVSLICYVTKSFWGGIVKWLWEKISKALGLSNPVKEPENVNYLSSVTLASEVFVGREHELGVLTKMLSEQKVPVITGAGGIGKSELVRQYAARRRAAYPGGCFQVDMETARSWNDVFEKLLAGRLGNGQFVRDLLDDRKEEEKSRPLDGAQALLRWARRSGTVLLFLDNVESVGTFVGKNGRLTVFTTDFADGVRLDIVMTARVNDAVQHATGCAVELPLGDLSPEAAQELLLREWPEADEAEREAAGRVAELLGYRALHLRQVSGLIGDINAPVVCNSFTELEGELRENFSKTVREGVEKDYWPEVLWKMTCTRLLELKSLGPACIKLAQTASFFSPDGFARHILKYLWTTLVAPEAGERTFDRAVEIVRRRTIFQSGDPVRVHRLHREAVLQTAKAEFGLEDRLGRALADYGLLSKEDWLPLCEHDGIRAHLPAELAQDGSFGVSLLIAWPKLADCCPWENLGGEDWMRLLCDQPQFADRCPWEKLDGRDWCCLLRARPQFAGRCPWEKLDGGAWADLLRAQPQFADRCPWEKLDGGAW
ncbi:MAG: AAA family ATPase, partial [Kiritimatiellae bacterium]|nr:AAA family ATPase [Kiritimatiellia bacterium]